MNIINEHNYTPNVLHFHGMNIEQLTNTFNTIYKYNVVSSNYDKSRLKIVSTWTDDTKCCLYQQCKKFGIEVVNCVPSDYDTTQKWYMPNKIKFFIDVLKNTKEELVLFLDGYDVLLTGLDNIIERFESQPYRILFGPSCNNYPKCKIDKIYGRANHGMYRYFNAGCVLGYTKDLLQFYTEALQYINVHNVYNSEQFVLRIAFSKYSSDKNQNFIGIDYNSIIFQSMGMLNTRFNKDEVYFETRKSEIKENILLVKQKLEIQDNDLLCSDVRNMYFLELSKLKNSELVEYIFEENEINKLVIKIDVITQEFLDICKELQRLLDLYEVTLYLVIPDANTRMLLKNHIDAVYFTNLKLETVLENI